MKILYISLVFCMTLYSCGTNQQMKGNAEENGFSEFKEPHRPQFHFTPLANWMNDPNGMVYYDGEYHLFYQYHPESTIWGPMHWGHAVSTDMIHWEHLPIALYPDELGTIFSGSAVMDLENTSGLGTEENPAMVAIFTYHDVEREKAGRDDYQTQAIAFSLDKGRSWNKYEGNPVLLNPGIRDFRDPKVAWNEGAGKWIMSLAVADRISFYSSPNLIDWEHESDFGTDIGAHGGVWECPDLFKMTVEGTDEEKWVLLVSINPGGPNGGSATQYFVGDFDGSRFTLEEGFRRRLTDEKPLPEGKLFADFEANNYQSWKAEGEAFGQGPAQGAIGNQQAVSGFEGRGLVNSFHNGDATTGKLVSPPFTIENDYINLMVGGGKHPERTAVNLIIDNKVARTATGNNSESLGWKTWETRDLKGKEAHIEIIDQVKGGWGHIMVDHIMFADEAAAKREDGIWIDYGKDNYAGVTWANVPEEDGRRLFMGWMSNWEYANEVPTEKWRSAMTVARTLSLENTTEGYRLITKPVKEIENIYGERYSLKAQQVSTSLEISEQLPFTTATYELKLELEAVSAETAFALELSNAQGQKMIIGYDSQKEMYYTDRRQAGNHNFSDEFAGIHYAPRIAGGQQHSIRLLVDVASLELFADGGKTVMTDIFFPDETFTELRLIVNGGQINLKSGTVIELNSIGNANL